MTQIRLVFLLIFFCFVSCFPSKKATSRAITYKGGHISVKEIDEKAQLQLYKIRKEEYETRYQVAMEILGERLLKAETDRTGKDADILMGDYVKKNFTPFTEQELKDYYQRIKSRINKPYVAIKAEMETTLNDRRKKQIEQNFIHELMNQYKVEINLEEPVAPHIDLDIAGEPFWGNPNAKVVVVEFSDLECPYCKRMQPDVAKIRKEFEGKIKWVFKDFPLSFHRNAKGAHVAANCAGKQNKYFEFQGIAFEKSPDIGPESLSKIANQINLDAEKFKQCIEDKDGSISAEIEEDIEYAQKVGVSGTPTLFVNGKMAQDFRDYAGMKRTIEEEL